MKFRKKSEDLVKATLTSARWGGTTLHNTGDLDIEVEVHDGKVVAVWLRCLMLPFIQHDVSAARADSLSSVEVQQRRIAGINYLGD